MLYPLNSHVIIILMAFLYYTSALSPNLYLGDEVFNEILTIETLQDDSFLFMFNFSYVWDISVDDSDLCMDIVFFWFVMDIWVFFFFFDIFYPYFLVKNYNLFPKSIGKVIEKNHILEFDLSFTQGRWDYHKWGIIPYTAPSGVELVARFYPTIDESKLFFDFHLYLELMKSGKHL